MDEIKELVERFRELRKETYRAMALGQDYTEKLSRLQAMHAILVRKAIDLLNLVILQKDQFYVIAPIEERDRLILYSDGFKLLFPEGREMTEEEITEHQRQAMQKWQYFSEHLLAVNYIDEYINFLLQNYPEKVEELVVKYEPVDLSKIHEDELDKEEKYVSENVSEKKKSNRRKRETPL